MDQTELFEAATVLVIVLLVGAVFALFFGSAAVHRREKAHRQLSASRRAENTSYDLFSPKSGKNEEPTRTRGQRRRRSKSQEMIDLSPKDVATDSPGSEAEPN